MTASFKKSFLGAIIAVPKMAMNSFSSSLGGAQIPKFKIGQTYTDGLGRRKKIPEHPSHNSKMGKNARLDFIQKVEATHSRNIDPRNRKYLNSYARRMRAVYPQLAAGELFA